MYRPHFNLFTSPILLGTDVTQHPFNRSIEAKYLPPVSSSNQNISYNLVYKVENIILYFVNYIVYLQWLENAELVLKSRGIRLILVLCDLNMIPWFVSLRFEKDNDGVWGAFAVKSVFFLLARFCQRVRFFGNKGFFNYLAI